MTARRPPLVLRTAFIVIWGLSTLSLGAWWLYFGLQQVHRIGRLEGSSDSEIVRYHKMLVGEGAFLLFLLVCGIVALAYFMIREMRERRRIQEFFAAFTHELKTPLASLLLNVELLAEESRDSETRRRLASDLGRLNLQLENSLFLVNGDQKLLLEPLHIGAIIERLRESFPTLEISITGDAVINLDRRAADTIFGNLLTNAMQHGHASRVDVVVELAGPGRSRVTITDNGSGFQGERTRLSALFQRHYAGSGSGIGLYLVSKLVGDHGGSVRFPESERGFEIELLLPGVPR